MVISIVNSRRFGFSFSVAFVLRVNLGGVSQVTVLGTSRNCTPNSESTPSVVSSGTENDSFFVTLEKSRLKK